MKIEINEHSGQFEAVVNRSECNVKSLTVGRVKVFDEETGKYCWIVLDVQVKKGRVYGIITGIQEIQDKVKKLFCKWRKPRAEDSPTIGITGGRFYISQNGKYLHDDGNFYPYTSNRNKSNGLFDDHEEAKRVLKEYCTSHGKFYRYKD